MVATAETLIMLMYSARKNQANFIDEYSVMVAGDELALGLGEVERQRGSSRRPSRSRRRTNAGIRATPHHSCCWESTICDVDMDPATMNTVTSDRPIASS